MKKLTRNVLLSSALALVACGSAGPQGPAGPTGLQGPAGPTGSQGEKGDPGMDGMNGMNGATGPSGPTLFKRVEFDDVAVSKTANAVVSLKTLSFTTPTKGIAVITSRGYCIMKAETGAANQIDITPAFVADDLAFDNADDWNWGRLLVPQGSVSGVDFYQSWTSELTLDVDVGGTTTLELAARRTSGTSDATCNGTFSVQVFTGNLP